MNGSGNRMFIQFFYAIKGSIPAGIAEVLTGKYWDFAIVIKNYIC